MHSCIHTYIHTYMHAYIHVQTHKTGPIRRGSRNHGHAQVPQDSGWYCCQVQQEHREWFYVWLHRRTCICKRGQSVGMIHVTHIFSAMFFLYVHVCACVFMYAHGCTDNKKQTNIYFLRYIHIHTYIHTYIRFETCTCYAIHAYIHTYIWFEHVCKSPCARRRRIFEWLVCEHASCTRAYNVNMYHVSCTRARGVMKESPHRPLDCTSTDGLFVSMWRCLRLSWLGKKQNRADFPFTDVWI